MAGVTQMHVDTLKAALLLGVNVNDTSVSHGVKSLEDIKSLENILSEKYAHVPADSKSCNSSMLTKKKK